MVEGIKEYIWLIPLFPLIGFLINGLIGNRIGNRLVGLLACSTVGLSFLVSLGSFLELLGLHAEDRLFEKAIYTWIGSGTFKSELAFQLDPLSAVMILTVTFVGFLIHVYSIGYMHGDKGYARYFCYLNLFTASMLLLVLGNNFLVMFVGWEGVGLCSYLLIGFWFEKKSASDAGKKAFIVNRVGDFGFLLGIMLIYVNFGTIDFTEVFEKAHHLNLNAPLFLGLSTVTVITLLLFVGATGKSAQVPLYVWLPDAMEGPTPVSALIHAATMVTAGVYMVVRCNVLYSMSSVSMNVVAIVGLVTALLSATIGLVQNDIKRVLAYSTVSQLGYMFLACGVGAFSAGVFHLMTHAYFKALLFLGAGSVIHGLSNIMDMRQMGGMRKVMPVTFFTFVVATIAIAGFPPFSGFFSKDEILWMAFSNPEHGHWYLWLGGWIAAGLTSFYMFRLVFMTFAGECRAEKHIQDHMHESPKVMTVPLAILAVGAALAGFVGVPHVLGHHVGLQNYFHDFLQPVIGGAHHGAGAVEHANHGVLGMSETQLEWLFMGLSVFIALLGLFVAYTMYVKNKDIPAQLAKRFRFLYELLLNKYYVDEFYNAMIVQPIKNTSDHFLWRFFDVHIIDGFVNGVAWVTERLSRLNRFIQSGYVQSYAFFMFLGLALILWYIIFK